jgi:hypothetical protein
LRGIWTRDLWVGYEPTRNPSNFLKIGVDHALCVTTA